MDVVKKKDYEDKFLSAKHASLIALVLQQVLLVLMIRHSRTAPRKTGDEDINFVPYLASTAVVSAECLKLLLNLSLEKLLVKPDEQMKSSSSTIGTKLVNQEALKLAIPALLYLVQNNLLFVALSNLSVPVYQVTNQGKLLTTAVCSRLMLNKSISGMQYVSLAVLALGVALVQLSSMERKEPADDDHDQNQLLGLIAVIISCFTSGFAGVYFEKMIKSDSAQNNISVYMRNCQLAIWSVLLGLIPVFTKDLYSIQQNGFFQGYNSVVIGVICCQAMTGLIVALVMKYADTILKGFATSVAVVLATVLSIFIWKARVDAFFIFGAAMVMLAVRIYTMYPSQPPQAKEATRSRQESTAPRNTGMRRWGSFFILFAGIMQVVAHYIVLVPEQKSQEMQELLTVKAISDGSKMQEVQHCGLRDLSNYTEWKKPFDEGSRESKWAHCLRFQCMNNQSLCDNFAPTNFAGPDPPCCVHILRDMAREFDRAMCHLGLEYFPAFGMLLGLTRADKLIPWTIDNDYIVTKQTLSAMEDLWDSASHLNHGVGFHFDQIYRLCATPSFADGKLLRWKANETKSWYANSVYPFADLFSLGEPNGTTLIDQRSCYYDASSLRPAVRRAVYNGTFYQNFPQNPDALLTEYFGSSWKVPDAKKKSHGGTHCGRNRDFAAKRKAKRESRLAKK
jgi:UDP-sugar transporter A1/2/3